MSGAPTGTEPGDEVLAGMRQMPKGEVCLPTVEHSLSPPKLTGPATLDIAQPGVSRHLRLPPPPPKHRHTPTRIKLPISKAAAKRDATMVAKPRKAVAKSSARKPTKAAAKELPAHYALPKAEGDGAVQAWIDLLPDWQSARARRVDVVTRQVPNVHKAIKWHGARYGVPGQGWFLAVGSFKAHLKLVFFDGASLTPVPPSPLATEPQRALDVREGDKLDEAQLSGWVKQASQLPRLGQGLTTANFGSPSYGYV